MDQGGCLTQAPVRLDARPGFDARGPGGEHRDATHVAVRDGGDVTLGAGDGKRDRRTAGSEVRQEVDLPRDLRERPAGVVDLQCEPSPPGVDRHQVVDGTSRTWTYLTSRPNRVAKLAANARLTGTRTDHAV